MSDYITALAFASPHQWWAASSAAGEVVLIDRSGTKIELLPANDRSIMALAWSGDARWLAAGGEGGALMLWDWQGADRTPDRLPQVRQVWQTANWIELIEWHPTQPYVAVSSCQQVEIFHLPSTERVASLTFDRSSVFDLAWEPNGNRLAVAGYRGVQMWSSEDWKADPVTLPVETASIKLAWSTDGRYLAAGNLDRSLSIWDALDFADPWLLQGCGGKIRDLAWGNATVDSQPVLAVATGTDLVCWQLAADPKPGWSGEVLTGHQAPLSAIAMHPTAIAIASAALDGYICLWTPSGEVLQILQSPQTFGGLTTLVWDKTGTNLIAGDEYGGLFRWSDGG